MASPMEEFEKGLKELKGFAPIGRTSVSTNQMPQCSQGLSHQAKGTQGSSCLCGREFPCQVTMGREVLRPVKIQKMPQCRGFEAREVGGVDGGRPS